jgi:hypothetical protein
VEGISQACVSNPDERLFDLLSAAIAEAQYWMPFQEPAVEVAQQESAHAVVMGPPGLD